MSSKLSDNIEKDSVFWVKWEMEDENGNKFIPPVFVYYKAKATGERSRGNFQIRYEDGLLNWVPIRTANASSQKIVSEDKFDEEKGWPIVTAPPEPRIGPEFQAIIASGPQIAQTEFQKRALNLVPLTNEEIKADDKKFESSAAVAQEFKRTSGEKKGKGGRRKKTRKMKGGHHLYKRLGVSKYASQKQIKKAYNKLKKKKKLTKKVKYAYKILSKKKTRKQYNNRYRKVMKHKRHTRKKRGGNVWKLKEEYENIMNKYDHDIFWINNAHKGQKAAREVKNVWRKFAGKTKPKNEAQAKVQRNTKLEALKEKAWKLCKPVKEKFDKIKENVKVAKEGQGNLTLELKNGKFVDIDPKNIHPAHVKGGPGFDWNVWTTKLMYEFQEEQGRLEAEMNKSGLYGVCDIYDEIEKKLREDEDKENNPHEENKQQELDNNLRKMGLRGY